MKSYSRSRPSRWHRAPSRAILHHSSLIIGFDFFNAPRLPNQSLVFVVFFGFTELDTASQSGAGKHSGT
jgi:hypothetical protein